MTAQCDLPFHPFTGLQAVGLVAGRPVWPILGAAETEEQPAGDADEEADDSPQESDADPTDTESDEDDKPLGPAGQKAYEAEKQKRKDEAARRREAERKLAALEAKSGDDNPDADAIRRQADLDATKRVNARILKSEVKAAATGKLADPSDAHKFLDFDSFEVDEDGNVDEDEIAEAIADLIAKKPYLAAQGGTKQHGSADGGARKGSRPKQLTREQLSSMNSDEIEAARVAGRLNDLLGIK